MKVSMELRAKSITKFTEIIQRGEQRAQQTVESILREYKIRKDYLLPAAAIRYEVEELDGSSNQVAITSPYGIRAGVNGQVVGFTEHSIGQLLGRVGLPRTYVEAVRETKEPWATELLLENLRKFTDHSLKDDRLLFRTVGDLAKGVLSSAYRRMDAAPIIEAFIKAGLAEGLVPMDGLNTDTRYNLKLIHRELYEPVPGEVIAFGLGLTTSDYGQGALLLSLILMRIWCTNLAIGENCLRKVHIGKRFDEAEELVLSQKTYDLDTQTVASAVKDIIRHGLTQKAELTCRQIQHAASQEVSIDAAVESFRRKGILSKEQALTAKNLYETVDEITLLPPKDQGTWRLANVLSLMARSEELTGDKQLELQEASAALLAA